MDKCPPCQENECEQSYTNSSVCEGGFCTCTYCQESGIATFFTALESVSKEMDKCPPCQENECKQSYANRIICRGGGCTCTCQESGIANFFTAVESVSMKMGKCQPCQENECEQSYTNNSSVCEGGGCTCTYCQESGIANTFFTAVESVSKEMDKCQPCQENQCKQSYANRSICQGGGCMCTCQKSGIATFFKAVESVSKKMGKCQPCQDNECKQSYVNRSICQGGGDCTCTCQESRAATFWKAVGSISAGAVCVAGGVGITILSAGFAAPLGGAIIGAGSSLITAPIAKKLTGECVSSGELLADVSIGATVGALTGGIGAGGSALSKGATGLVKFGVRAGAGAAAGAVGGAVSETARKIQGEEVSLKSYGRSIGIGLACGSIGGASSHLASNVSNGVSSGIAKAATRVVIQSGTATVTDAGMQLYEAGGDFSQIDGKRLLVTAASQVTVATTAECASSVTLKSNLYNDKLNQMLVENEHQEGLNKKAENLDGIKTKLEDLKAHKAELRNIQNDNTATPQEKQERIQRYRDDNKLGTSKSIMKRVNQRIAKLERQIGPNKPNYEQAAMQKDAATQRLRQANRLPPEVIKEETQKVQQYNKLSSEIQELQNHKSNIENIRADPNPDLTPRDKHQMEQKYLADNKLGNGLKRVNQRIAKLEAKLVNVEPSKIGKDNLHFLTGDRTGQIAMDVPDENGNRGRHRIIADHNTGNNKFVYADQSEKHDYDNMKKRGENQQYDPFKAQFKDLPANQFYKKRDEHDDEKDKKE